MPGIGTANAHTQMKFSNQIFWALNKNVPDIRYKHTGYIYTFICIGLLKLKLAIFRHHSLVLLVEKKSTHTV